MQLFTQLFVSLDEDYSERDIALFLLDKGWDADMIHCFLDDLFLFTIEKDALRDFEDVLKCGSAKRVPKED